MTGDYFTGGEGGGAEKYIFIGKLLILANQNKPISKDYNSKKFYGLLWLGVGDKSKFFDNFP